MKRSPIKRYTKLRAANPERRARVAEQRKQQRRDPEWQALDREARRIAKERANGICECGCGRPFDTSAGPKGPGYPEFDHESYRRPRGKYLRRECHHFIEKTTRGHRHVGRWRE